MIRLILAYSCLFSCLLTISCATRGAVKTDTGKHSLNAVYKAIEYAMPGGVASRTDNNRGFKSFYHPPGGNPNTDARKKRIRAYAMIRLLGARRPYDVEVEYHIEERDKRGRYKTVKKNEYYANQILDRIKDYLVSRPSKRDLIDDFKPF